MQSRQAGDEVASILDSLARLRADLKDAGPLVTSRIWKAEMELKKAGAQIASAGSTVSVPVKPDSGALRSNAGHIRPRSRHPHLRYRKESVLDSELPTDENGYSAPVGS